MPYGFNVDKSRADLNSAIRTDDNSNNTASGNHSHAEGDNTVASGNYSHAEGTNTVASGTVSHAEGSGTSADGSCSHAEGSNTHATGLFSHAEGGYNTIASGSVSHAEGSGTIANGNTSHAEGDGTKALGFYSHAEGNETIALGNCSHAEGIETVASGNQSHASGDSTIASGTNQVVIGKFNIPDSKIVNRTGDGSTTAFILSPETSADDYYHTIHVKINGVYTQDFSKETANSSVKIIFNTPPANNASIEIEISKDTYALIIGNGTDDDHRSNALAIKWDGTMFPACAYILDDKTNSCVCDDVVFSTSETEYSFVLPSRKTVQGGSYPISAIQQINVSRGNHPVKNVYISCEYGNDNWVYYCHFTTTALTAGSSSITEDVKFNVFYCDPSNTMYSMM